MWSWLNNPVQIDCDIRGATRIMIGIQVKIFDEEGVCVYLKKSHSSTVLHLLQMTET